MTLSYILLQSYQDTYFYKTFLLSKEIGTGLLKAQIIILGGGKLKRRCWKFIDFHFLKVVDSSRLFMSWLRIWVGVEICGCYSLCSNSWLQRCWSYSITSSRDRIPSSIQLLSNNSSPRFKRLLVKLHNIVLNGVIHLKQLHLIKKIYSSH